MSELVRSDVGCVVNGSGLMLFPCCRFNYSPCSSHMAYIFSSRTVILNHGRCCPPRGRLLMPGDVGVVTPAEE